MFVFIALTFATPPYKIHLKNASNLLKVPDITSKDAFCRRLPLIYIGDRIDFRNMNRFHLLGQVMSITQDFQNYLLMESEILRKV